MRTWIWLPIIGLLALAGGGAFLVKPLLVSMAESRAAARGVLLEPGSLSLGLMSGTLTDSTARLEGVPSVVVHLREVELGLGWAPPGLREIAVRGGRVEVTGSIEDVREQLSAFAERHRPSSSGNEPSGPRRVERIRDMNVVWRDAFAPGDQQSIQGFAVDRGPSGQHFGADLISLNLGHIQLEVAGALLRAEAGGLDLRKISDARAAEARVTYKTITVASQDSDTRADGEAQLPDRAAATPGGSQAAPDVAIEKQRDSGLSRLIQPDPTRVARVRAAFDLYRHQLLPRLPTQIEIEKLWVSYRRDDERLHLGPSRLLLTRSEDGLRVKVAPEGSGVGTTLTLTLDIPHSPKESLASLELEGGPVALSTLGVAEGAFGLSGVRQTSIVGALRARLEHDASQITSEGQVTLEGLSLESRKLSPNLVLFPRVSAEGKGALRVDGSAYSVSQAKLAIGDARMQGDLSLEKGEDFVTLRANLDAPLVSCQALLDSAPKGLLGPVELMKFRGTFSLVAGVDADTRNLNKMQVRWDFKNDCHATSVPVELDPEQFRGLFRREVVGAGNLPMEVEFGPLSSSWTPYEEISPYVESAILVSEDGRFYRHDGFDDRAIESAIAQNTRAGRFLRGASTVTMQLAKNLFLSREKNLARKLQEAALTSLLEQSFEKKELLTLYMNIVEFGPGVYGISQAATHYFNCRPAQLSAAQAFFLVSILPAPSVNYFQDDGTLAEERARYVRHLLSIAQKRGRLSESELELALHEELHLGQPSTQSEELFREALPDQDPLMDIPNPAALRHVPDASRPGAGHVSKPDSGASAPTPPPEKKLDPRRRGIHL